MMSKSDEQSMADASKVSFGGSTNSLVKGVKKTFSNDLWWKITITLAVIIIAGFIIYKAVHDSKKSSEKTTLSSSSQSTKSDEEGAEEEVSDCTEGSIADSRAKFTYQPLNSNKPYTAHGLEFSLKDIKLKPGVEAELTELDSATPKIHYYYNIRRCEIGGGIRTDEKPYIKGPKVFAVDQQCSKVYYYSKDKGWTQYRSARNLDCTSHGKEEIPVEKSKCLEGSIMNSTSSFVYIPNGETKPYRASGVEFSFEMIAKKTKLGSRLTPLNKLMASTSKIHYYYNIPRCQIGGGLRKPNIRGPIVFAVDQQCESVYYFTEGNGWLQYISARNVQCSSHDKCFKGSLEGSYSTFQFFSSFFVNVTGIQYNFTNLVGKLNELDTNYNLTRIPEVTGTQDVSYYLNLHRCYNGGSANQKARGAIIFAVTDNCSKVYYLSRSRNYQWIQYASARSIKCIKRNI